MSETRVLVNTKADGIILIEYHPKTTKSRVALTASGIINVVPGCPFHVLVNFAEKPTHLPKYMRVAVGDGAPQWVVNMDYDAGGDKIDPITARNKQTTK